MLLVWDDSLSVGIEEIDLEHRELVDLVNQLHQSIRDDQDQAQQIALIEQIKERVQGHFDTEERWFKEHGFPEAEEHIERHQEFLQRMSDFQTQIEFNRFGVGVEMTLFLSEWLETHLKDEDQRYSKYFTEQGIIAA